MEERNEKGRATLFSIILVDDEQEIRESISELVEWEQNGFDFLGAAENGVDALQLIEKQVPDILITDIKMPVMDGIKLAQRVREEYPTIKIIFLSGYDEFEFAISGIKLNVTAYLLKPIMKKELENTLSQLRDELEEEAKSATDIHLIEQGYLANMEVMKISFLISLLTENYPLFHLDELQSFLSRYHLNFLLKKKVILNIHLDNRNTEEEPNNRQVELLRFSLSNLVRNTVGKYVQAEVFLFASNVICLIGDEEEKIEETLDVLAKEIYASARKLFRKKITIGISEQFERLSDTKAAFQSTIEAINYAKVYKKGHIVSISDIESTSNEWVGFNEELESQLLLALKLGEEKEVRRLIDEVTANLYVSSSRYKALMRLVLGEFFILTMRALRESGVELDEKYLDQFGFSQEMMEYENIETVRRRLFDFCREMMKKIQEYRENQTSTLAAQGKQYLKEHYADAELSLKKVSGELLISPSYFSSVFKKEIGRSFTEVLADIRMKKAKELVLTSDLKMFEIALKCGFADQHYFSYSFKKYYNQSPSKMRKAAEQNDLFTANERGTE